MQKKGIEKSSQHVCGIKFMNGIIWLFRFPQHTKYLDISQNEIEILEFSDDAAENLDELIFLNATQNEIKEIKYDALDRKVFAVNRIYLLCEYFTQHSISLTCFEHNEQFTGAYNIDIISQ